MKKYSNDSCINQFSIVFLTITIYDRQCHNLDFEQLMFITCGAFEKLMGQKQPFADVLQNSCF